MFTRAQAGDPITWHTVILDTDRESLSNANVPNSIPPKLRRAWVQTRIVTAEDENGEAVSSHCLNFLLVEEIGSLRVAYIEYTPCEAGGSLDEPESSES